MKSKYILIASALFGLVAATSCSKEPTTPESPVDPVVSTEDGLVTFTFKADVEEPITRVSADESDPASISYQWQAGDEIKVLYDGGSTTATAVIAGGAATFSPSVPGGTTTLWMVYPSSLGASLVGGRLKIDMPAVQEDDLPAVFVASCDASDASVTFRHPVAWYKMVVDGDGSDVTRLELSSAGGKDLAASAMALDFDASGIPSVYSRDNVASEMTLDFSGAGTYYIPIVPDVAKDASDLTFQFYRGIGGNEKAGAYKHAKALLDERSSLVNWGSLPAMATNRYVSTSGSSSNNGATADKPWDLATFKGFMENIPGEIMEAAWIDGADVWTVYTKIAMPLASPAIASVSIFNFLTAWEEYPWANTVINDNSKRTLPIAIAGFFGQHQFTQWGYVFAMSVLTLIPVVLIFILCQKFFVQGLTAGSVKG